ncbi:hypothetical protein TESG_06125 [Trichophyton tonsurans CBS 112818]|uniref:Uncharacterized protein n=1 Tax=Trichophyton tonsurans (strain CBS 112818) TaxID=647933 RepID=F2S4Z6_TRIT1|nr:hypothetical protein TESG_06125 [Trichophyton tonsurans CBS 112818]
MPVMATLVGATAVVSIASAVKEVTVILVLFLGITMGYRSRRKSTIRVLSAGSDGEESYSVGECYNLNGRDQALKTQPPSDSRRIPSLPPLPKYEGRTGDEDRQSPQEVV